MIVVEAMSAAAIAKCTAMTAPIKPATIEALSACCTKIIVATIAPGPASSGVPNGTSAMLPSSLSERPLPLPPVNKSSEIKSSNKAPAACIAAIETLR